MKLDFDKIKNIFDTKSDFVITTHVNPDGDGLGSELALSRILRKLSKKVSILNHNSTPDNYQWLDTEREIVQFVPEIHTEQILNTDVILIVDTNQPDRLRSLEYSVNHSKAVKIMIDHHLEAHEFTDYYLTDSDATSTGEIIYEFMKKYYPGLIDKNIATFLYTAIMTDTGSFRYPRTDSNTHNIISELVQYGVSPQEIYANIYENWSTGYMRLLGFALASMKTAYEGKLVYITCTQKMFEETGTSEVETDNYTTFPMSVENVKIGILFNELKDGIKISFRSKGLIPVNELAKEFGGNGHLNAAGARLSNINLHEAINIVVEKAGKYLSNITTV